MAGAFVLPLLAGLALDRVFRMSPVGILAGVFVGIAAAGATVFVRFKRYL